MGKINPVLCPIGFIGKKVVHIFIDIIYNLCKHSDRSQTMKRLYKRMMGKFTPSVWMCPDCGKMQIKEPGRPGRNSR